MVSVKPDHNTEVEDAVAEGGAYELIRKRLEDQATQLDVTARKLNGERLQEFGETSMGVAGRARVRTENNCIARDIVQVSDYLLFGYNVFIGLKTETAVNDVFGLYKLVETEEGYKIEAADVSDSFLDDKKFMTEFHELYSYYKQTHLLKLRKTHNRLLAFFQIGEKIEDVRVFRWSIENSGVIKYIDDRGEREYSRPSRYDFEWIDVSRKNHVNGKHPHISILDELFIETIGGHLTIKVENNTEDGLGIYQEDVEDKNQSLADANIQYAKAGSLILLRVQPYRENNWRYIVFNTINKQINRIDALQDACIQLPEDHGIIYPGGYYLQSGETKSFGDEAQGMFFENAIYSPNGEDVLYLFYRALEGKLGLFNYNLIRKELSTPLYGHGFSLFEDGKAILFTAESEEPSRNHPMQIWETPFVSDNYASNQPESQTFFGKIGNAELVRAISEIYSLVRAIRDQSASAILYEKLIENCDKLFSTYYWIEDKNLQNLSAQVKDIRKTAELVLDEFEKVESIRAKANEAIQKAELTQKKLFSSIARFEWKTPGDFIAALDEIRKHRGHLVTIRDLRYINKARIAELDTALEKEQARLSQNTVRFLNQESAFIEYTLRIDELQEIIPSIETVSELSPIIEELEKMSAGLDLLTEMLGTLKVDDATVRTKILESISEVYGRLNQTKAHARNQNKSLGSAEAISEFAAQFTLFSQSITNALSLATTPENCDDQLTRLISQLEELESRFSEHDEFLADILSKREEVYESFESHKQALLDERQRRIHNLSNAAERILEGVFRRTERFSKADEINTFFASDAMVSKCRDLSDQLRELGDSVRADDIDSRLKFAKDQSVRSQRDKQDIFEDGGSIIKLGRHRFSVNTQTTDLTIVPKDDELALHLTGTDYFDVIDNKQLVKLQSYWQQSFVSESSDVYRAEYLAASILSAADAREEGLDLQRLQKASLSEGELLKLIKKFISTRYQEGYEKGIHDADAARILQVLLSIRKQAALLRYPPKARALAMLFWMAHSTDREKYDEFQWHSRAQSAELLAGSFNSESAYLKIRKEVFLQLSEYFNKFELDISTQDCQLSAEYLCHELTAEKLVFKCSQYGSLLATNLKEHLKKIRHLSAYQKILDDLSGSIDKQWALVESWLDGYLTFSKKEDIRRFIPEAIAIILAEQSLTLETRSVELQLTVTKLMGDHPRVEEQSMLVALDEFTSRLHRHINQVVPEYQTFLQLRQSVVEDEREKLRLEEFKARPLSSFVRNKLINDVYLPLIGDNLAKQMGTVGEDKRTDLMGLLLLISPPGYGKTTLMEYVASRMGLIFMKINCPSLGHDVHSLDPAQAPNATARQELEKINLGLEMGNNVMLYLDDIQHTHPEFLQKYISLCDGSRRIEGVWKGKSKTYDMRGKKFCVIMAGNPYTESGDTFKIPDMLANRADIYNLGDVLSGREEQFSMSYIENCLTSNAILAPLATRNMEDVYKFMRMAKGENIANTDLEHSYSGAEVNEIVTVLQKLYRVQEMVLRVNQQYIISAAQDDKYRVEPSFKLQGSYRNMNKMAEKISGIMNDKELNNMIRDHYLGEAQTLTSGAEENLLKLGELNNSLTDEENERWLQIKQDYARIQSMGGDDADPATKLANQVSKISQNLNGIQEVLTDRSDTSEPLASIKSELNQIGQWLNKAEMNIEVVNQPVPGMDKVLSSMGDAITVSLLPVVSAMEHKLQMDHDIWVRVKALGEDISNLKQSMPLIARMKRKAVQPKEPPAQPPTNKTEK
ncbi:ATPase involved in DNA repair [hydrothermal vent metagenome]|uniref:ATPase involved in DNA repair n=1 Tax=hydrothermal vent metagenome TaxID=652676 RepID=A0A3B0XIZ8_9ZZZZ